MAETLGTNNAMVKVENKKLVRHLIFNGPITKQDISSRLKLSLSTVSQNLKELISEGFVRKEGSLESTGGRRPELLVFRYDQWYSVGLEIRPRGIHLSLVDFAGKDFGEAYRRIEYKDQPKYWDAVNAEILSFAEAHGVQTGRIAVVGLAMSGAVRYSDRTFLMDPCFAAEQRRIGIDSIKARFPYVTILKDSALASSFIEVFHSDRHTFSSILLNLSDSIHGSIIIEGEQLFGLEWDAARFGHMVIRKDGKKCSCGKLGCFEAYCSTNVLAAQTGGDLEAFFLALEQGDPRIRNAWATYLDDLSIGLDNLLEIFDLRILIAGDIEASLVKCKEELLSKVGLLQKKSDLRKYISINTWGKRSASLGVALLAVHIFLWPEFKGR
jgi:predicted NBD/HSP70 family sugar kinase